MQAIYKLDSQGNKIVVGCHAEEQTVIYDGVFVNQKPFDTFPEVTPEHRAFIDANCRRSFNLYKVDDNGDVVLRSIEELDASEYLDPNYKMLAAF
jgi:hypothetical protein